jgi:CHAT domain-containing protein/Flp pilus assembly protein TadD
MERMHLLVTRFVWHGLFLIVVAIGAMPAVAIDGQMIEVTAATGQVKEGESVLAELPSGTRLWALEMDDQEQWARVNIPAKDKLGWLHVDQFRKIAPNDDESAQLQEAYGYYGEYAALNEQREFAAAVAKMRQCLEIELKVHGADHPDVADSWELIGNAVKELGELDEAHELHSKALESRTKMLGSRHPSALNSLFNLAVVLNRRGDKPAALAMHQRELQLCQEIRGEKDPSTLVSMNTVALLLSDVGDDAASRALQEKTLALRREVLGERDPGTLDSMNNLALVLSNLGEYQQARTLHEKTLEIRREELGAEDQSTLTSMSNLALVLDDMGEYEAARAMHEQALQLRRKVLGEENPDTLQSMNNLGLTLRYMGDYRASRDMHERELALSRKVRGEEDPSTLDSMNNLALVLVDLGDYAGARRLHEQELALCRKVRGDKHPSTFTSMSNLALVISNLGDYAAAQNLQEQVLKLRREVLGDRHPSTLDSMNNLALVLNDIGETEQSRQLQEETLRLKREVLGEKHPSTLDSMNNLGLVLRALGEYAAARDLHEQELTLCRELRGDQHPSTLDSMNNLALVLAELGDFAAARQLHEQELKLCQQIRGERHPSTLQSLNNVAGLLARMGEVDEAARIYQQTRQATRRYQAQLLPALSEKEQLLFLESADNWRFNACLSLAWAGREHGRVVSLSAGWLINGKAVAQEALAEGALLASSETAPDVARLRIVRSELARLSLEPDSAERQQKIADLETDQQQLIRRIGAAGTGLSQAEPWISLGLLRERLPVATVMVNMIRVGLYNFAEQTIDDDHYLAWVIPAMDEGRVLIVDLGDAEELDAMIEAARTALTESLQKAPTDGEPAATEAYRQALEQLAHAVLDPLEPMVDEAERLVLSPDGALWLVPWGALPIDDGKFLIEKYQIDYVTSGRELAGRGVARTAVGPPVVMANPAFDVIPNVDPTRDTSNLLAQRSAERLGHATPLPGTEIEAQAIRPTLATYARSEPLYRPRALVLSTHGFFFHDQQVRINDDAADGDQEMEIARTDEGQFYENPLLRCGLLLSGCNRTLENAPMGTDDGVLTGLEIVGTDLRGTDLVVLSACETGLGEIRSGEGVAGLRQAFQLAGADAVVATLWKIPDRETARLMNEFFGNLAAGQSKGEALRNAQLARIAARRERFGAAHPFFWAAFTLTGKN